MSFSAAVIGGGLAGLTAARELATSGLFSAVRVFEKSSSFGRLAAKRDKAAADVALQWDTGAQYFTARSTPFVQQVSSWQKEGVVGEWKAALAAIEKGNIMIKNQSESRFVAVPNMRAMCESLEKEISARGVVLHKNTRVLNIKREGSSWLLSTESKITSEGLSDRFSHVVVAAPAPQALSLLSSSPLADKIKKARMAGCWALMLAFAQPLNVSFQGAFVNGSSISWVANNSSKPGRPQNGAECWMVHASPDWSDAHIEDKEEEVTKHLKETFYDALKLESSLEPLYARVFKWRYASVPEPLNDGFLADERAEVFVCGDWCNGGRVEGAFMSGYLASKQLISSLKSHQQSSSL